MEQNKGRIWPNRCHMGASCHLSAARTTVMHSAGTTVMLCVQFLDNLIREREGYQSPYRFESCRSAELTTNSMSGLLLLHVEGPETDADLGHVTDVRSWPQ